MHIFIAPPFIPYTSANRHFYEEERYNKQNKSGNKPDKLYRLNDCWSSVMNDAFSETIDFSKGKLYIEEKTIYETLLLANCIFERVCRDFIGGCFTFHSAFVYFWNRLACYKNRLDLMIDRIKIRGSNEFRPLIQESKLLGKTVKTLTIHDRVLDYKRELIIYSVQLLFSYIEGSNKDFYGRLTKQFIQEKNFQLSKQNPYEASVENFAFDSRKQYIVFTDFNSLHIKMNKSHSPLDKFEKIIEGLDPKKMEEAYNYLLNLVQRVNK